MRIRMRSSRVARPNALLGLVLLTSALLTACGGGAALPGQAADPADCGSDMSSLEQSATAEGAVTVYAPPGTVRPALVDQFNRDYPNIRVTLWQQSTDPNSMLARLQSEDQANRTAADVAIGANRTVNSDLFVPLPDELVLPETRDASLWTTDGMRYRDEEKKFLYLQFDIGNSVVVNTNSPARDITSYDELFDPRWNGQIIIGDPNLDAQALFAYAALRQKYGDEFFARLAETQPIVVGDAAQIVQQVAQGASAIGIGTGSTVLANYLSRGAPIAALYPENYSYVSAGYWNIGMLAKAPHPCAARLYTNWLLTANAQASLSATLHHVPLRTDVPTPEGVQPLPENAAELVDPGADATAPFMAETTDIFYEYIDGPGKGSPSRYR